MCSGCVHNLSEVRPAAKWVGSCVVGVAIGVGVVVDGKTPRVHLHHPCSVHMSTH